MIKNQIISSTVDQKINFMTSGNLQSEILEDDMDTLNCQFDTYQKQNIPIQNKVQNKIAEFWKNSSNIVSIDQKINEQQQDVKEPQRQTMKSLAFLNDQYQNILFRLNNSLIQIDNIHKNDQNFIANFRDQGQKLDQIIQNILLSKTSKNVSNVDVNKPKQTTKSIYLDENKILKQQIDHQQSIQTLISNKLNENIYTSNYQTMTSESSAGNFSSQIDQRIKNKKQTQKCTQKK